MWDGFLHSAAIVRKIKELLMHIFATPKLSTIEGFSSIQSKLYFAYSLSSAKSAFDRRYCVLFPLGLMRYLTPDSDWTYSINSTWSFFSAIFGQLLFKSIGKWF